VTCADKAALGAYVLGALDERERDRVDEHVATCDRCRADLEALIPVRAYLVRLADDELGLESAAPTQERLATAAPAVPDRPGAAPPTPDRLGTTPPTPDRVGAAPPRRPWLVRRALPSAAAIAAAVLLALVAWPRGADEPPIAGSRSSAVDARTGVRASVAATSRMWGTELRVRMSGATPGERCRLIARARDGRSDVAATWWTTYGGSAEVTGAAAIPAADLVALDVMTAAGRRLVHVPMNQ
jgi:anti-sigma factor RsiW